MVLCIRDCRADSPTKYCRLFTCSVNLCCLYRLNQPFSYAIYSATEDYAYADVRCYSANHHFVICFYIVEIGIGNLWRYLCYDYKFNIVFFFIFFFSRRYLLDKSEKFDLSGFYRIGLAAWLIGFVSFALGKQTDIILLNYFGVPSSEVGFYNIAFGFSVMLSFLGIGIGPIFQAIFSETYEKSGAKGLADSWYIIAKIGLLLWFPVFAFALLYAPSIIRIIYGEAFNSASGPFRILASFNMMYALLNASFAMPVFYLINKKTIGLCLRISAGILNLILDIILIPKYGVFGAVFATGSSMALIGMLEIGVVIKNIQARLPLVFYSKIILVFGLALLPTLLIGGETIIPIILKAVIYGISSIILMWLFKPMEEQDKLFVRSASEPLYQLVRYF